MKQDLKEEAKQGVFNVSCLYSVMTIVYYREHAMLAKTAGVKHLVVLVNKMDDPTVCWDETRSV